MSDIRYVIQFFHALRLVGMTDGVAWPGWLGRDDGVGDESGLENLSVGDGTAQSQFVSIFEVVTEAKASCKGGNLYPVG